MKVCVLSTESRSAIGGLAAYTRGLVRSLTDAGNEVSVVSRFDRDLSAQLDYAAGTSGAARDVDGVPGRTIGPAAWARPWLPRLRHLAGRPRVRRVATVLFAAAYRRALHAAVLGRIDVVHYVGTGFELLGFAAADLAWTRGAAFTIWPAVHAGTWGDSPLDIDLYRQADAVFCQSDHEVDHLVALGVPQSRLVRAWLAPAMPPSGDGRRFRERYGLGDRLLVLFIARKLRSKGYHTLVEAMASVAKVVPGVCLVAVGPDGDRPYPPECDAILLDLGVASEAEKADALSACDVFCMPSAAESFGIVFVEAWSYGKPVIGGPAPAVRELIRHCDGGVVLDGQNAEETARKLIGLLQDEAARTRLAASGADHVREKYNWSVVRDLHLRTFEQHCMRRHVL